MDIASHILYGKFASNNISNNLPDNLEVIFGDLENVYDYIHKHHLDPKRVCLIENALSVTNFINIKQK